MATKPDDQFIQRIEKWKKGILIESIKYQHGENAARQVPELQDASSADLVRLLIKELGEGTVNPIRTANSINIYVDDIDRGWSASSEAITNISALLNAIRDLGGQEPRIRFRIGLRTDVYFLVRTSDESTDKIEANVIWLRWSNNEVLRLVAKRIATYFNMGVSQEQIEKYTQSRISQEILAKVVEPEFKGKGHWDRRPVHNVLMSLTRARPRDLIKLLRLAAKRAHSKHAQLISSNYLEDIFETYSQERLQDIINEFRSELPTIEKLLISMKPTRREKTTSQSYLFTTATLTTKLENIIRQNTFSFTNGRIVSPRSLIQFLYKIDFITARRETSTGEIDRK